MEVRPEGHPALLTPVTPPLREYGCGDLWQPHTSARKHQRAVTLYRLHESEGVKGRREMEINWGVQRHPSCPSSTPSSVQSSERWDGGINTLPPKPTLGMMDGQMQEGEWRRREGEIKGEKSEGS
ncbi:unnamed protein product [Pleuronectes platessa]|uniref:Uncharacterized protein n=1 Tax=Pleuronectes platessa TaxID=8262 RepID=A0A9N7Y6B1_PLEPL|nr:unnamed protein product [Pleuronectes platessa]